jgi:hypothetical protein
MGKPRAREFGQVLADIIKDRQSNKEDCKRKNTSLKCFCVKCKTIPVFATQTVRGQFNKLQIQVVTYVFELSAGNCHC